MIIAVVLLLSIVSVLGSSYVNPVLDRDFPDPCVLKVNNRTFFAYATEGSGAMIQGAKSDDLVNWQWIGEVLGKKPDWARNSANFWAPDVQQHGNTFYLYFAATHDNDNSNMCIGVALSNNPAGPFMPTPNPVVCGNSFVAIDPKSFDDPVTGKIYLYWGSAFNPIRVQELSKDRLSLAPNSSPKEVVSPNPKPYHSLIEGAWLHQKNGWYYLYYSGNNCCGVNAAYAVMVSRSKSLTDSFTEAPDLVVQLNSRWLAPGHNSIVTDNAGQDWIYYHAIDKPTGNYNFRKLLMDKIVYDNQGWPRVQGGTPSTTSQNGPVV